MSPRLSICAYAGSNVFGHTPFVYRILAYCGTKMSAESFDILLVLTFANNSNIRLIIIHVIY